ncbi:MAG: gliding motility-associated peptidyl-prolyl isomerase GldI [Winogradskyella sp.]|uniref:gliding motility-associated peptidyl-prolyl isomerase GldI n=1 Tax=Winogradskyella sp. TaxID=1883156 RepID=UPI0017E2A9B6|nr:gliding motility-associated peptidyl-prolyl isomerase GldI [Winogradskyella sp.]MBT8243753.1 gliding motility-associated peptidyl-prolyl isomerase GldI [Winogradskyella sp.]NNK22054.1 gliding motility-associated peptidyl-prolyl isomerase GldI [Winogradskyella sp.]
MRHLPLIFILVIFTVSCKSPEARPPVVVKSGSFIEESVERNKALNKKERKEIQKVIASFSDKDFMSSENGFWYHYNSRAQNDMVTPQFGDRVEYTYTVSDLNGIEIYSEDEIGTQFYTMDKEELFSGLREGLKLMKASEDITFIFPSQKAFGYYGDNNKIGTNVPLICNVNLKTITQNND